MNYLFVGDYIYDYQYVCEYFWCQIAIAALIADYEDAVHTGALAPAHMNRNLWRNGLEFFWSQVAIAALLNVSYSCCECIQIHLGYGIDKETNRGWGL